MPVNFAPKSSLPVPRHVAVMPDGNGRWAEARGFPRYAGHRAGVDAVRRTVRAAPALGIETLTIHALSQDNVAKRPRAEVDAIVALVARFLDEETPACVREGVRVDVIGRRDRLPASTVGTIEAAESATRAGASFRLRLAIDYSSRDALARAFAPGRTREEAAAALGPDVDLLVRAGGERRVSDFLLWECAYAELVFVDTPWPDFGADDLAAAVAEYGRRSRRFGGVPESAAVGAAP